MASTESPTDDIHEFYHIVNGFSGLVRSDKTSFSVLYSIPQWRSHVQGKVEFFQSGELSISVLNFLQHDDKTPSPQNQTFTVTASLVDAKTGNDVIVVKEETQGKHLEENGVFEVGRIPCEELESKGCVANDTVFLKFILHVFGDAK